MIERYLLDTCALIYLAQDEKVASETVDVLRQVSPQSERIFVSAFSAWEIGMLVSKGRMNVTKSPLLWFEEVVEAIAAGVLEVSPEILVESSFMPMPLHADPADRILIATARRHGLTIITRDRAVLAYGAVGHVKVLAC